MLSIISSKYHVWPRWKWYFADQFNTDETQKETYMFLHDSTGYGRGGLQE